MRNVEFENGLSWLREDGARSRESSPQLSYGLTPTQDIIVQPSWRRAEAAHGRGDTNLDAKWRFYGEAPLSLGLRAGLTVPGETPARGLRRGTAAAHGLLVVSVDAQPYTWHGNLGITRLPAGPGSRREIGHVSSALMWAANESWTYTVEAGADSSPQSGRSAWLATMLLGLICTLRPGLDLDVGYQRSTRTQPDTRSVLVGLTYRFGL